MLLAVATMTMLVMLASSAFAHYCYNASRSEKGNAGAANSAAWMPVADLLAGEFGLCDEEIDYVLEGYPKGMLVHGRTVLAQGAEGTEVVSDGKGIDHADVDAIIARVFTIPDDVTCTA